MGFNFTFPKFRLGAEKSSKSRSRKSPKLFSGASGKIKLTVILSAISFALAIILAIFANQHSLRRAGYISIANDIEITAMQIQSDAAISLRGDAAAMDRVFASKQKMDGLLRSLDLGDDNLPETTGDPRLLLNDMLSTARLISSDADLLASSRKSLSKLGQVIESIDSTALEFRKIKTRMLATTNEDQAATLLLDVERIAHDISGLLKDGVDMRSIATLGIDLGEADELLAAMSQSDPTISYAKDLFAPIQSGVETIIGESREILKAKAASKSLMEHAGILSSQSFAIEGIYRFSINVLPLVIASAVLASLWIVMMLIAVRIYVTDSRRKAKTSEDESLKTQQSIMLLMDEMQFLSSGDLTQRTTVSEHITGAIADLINYTTDKLVSLVKGIRSASDQVDASTATTVKISGQLLLAAQGQEHSIRNAEKSVQMLSRSISDVDRSAEQAEAVGRRTLEVAERGVVAVRNAIDGMDGIRAQIQETSKRIKRLGESSQEIGEIVGLISDITGQTNVLSLNAAIQAAASGEAGRGFAVVAEEIQKLAERSGDAAKQINTLVKSIQNDTQEAISSMEKNTKGVVEGARLSDVAGQSLLEIEEVSKELASLIEAIFTATRSQTEMTKVVSSDMDDILRVTGQTIDGARMTSNSVTQLHELSEKLKKSVAGFKIK